MDSPNHGDNIEEARKELGIEAEPKRMLYACNFCERTFFTPMAYAGHQNAHREDRAKAKQAAENPYHGLPLKDSPIGFGFGVPETFNPWMVEKPKSDPGVVLVGPSAAEAFNPWMVEKPKSDPGVVLVGPTAAETFNPWMVEKPKSDPGVVLVGPTAAETFNPWMVEKPKSDPGVVFVSPASDGGTSANQKISGSEFFGVQAIGPSGSPGNDVASDDAFGVMDDAFGVMDDAAEKNNFKNDFNFKF